jgi:hypothetical protein
MYNTIFTSNLLIPSCKPSPLGLHGTAYEPSSYAQGFEVEEVSYPDEIEQHEPSFSEKDLIPEGKVGKPLDTLSISCNKILVGLKVCSRLLLTRLRFQQHLHNLDLPHSFIFIFKNLQQE